MKKVLRKKLMVLIVLVAFTLPTFQCGLILYPERRGRTKGEIDIPVLVMDCLWLIAGVVPGVVAIVVDFATGCIYESGAPVKTKAGQKVSLKLRGEAPAEADLLVTLSGKDTSSTLLSRHFAKGEQKLGTLEFSMPSEIVAGDYQLTISVNGQTNASWPVQVPDSL